MHLEPALDADAPLHFKFTCAHIESVIAQHEAISYTWGEPKLEYPLYVGDGTRVCIMVTRNLDKALRRLRHPTIRRTLWADAVCINQRNVVEKAKQIPLMTEIYRSASRVLVWLDGGDDQENGMKALNRWSRPMGPTINKRAGYPHSRPWGSWIDDVQISAICQFLDLAWFSRLWVVQEVAMNADVVLICGASEITWHRFTIALGICQRFKSRTLPGFDNEKLEALQIMVELWKHHSTPGNDQRLESPKQSEDIWDLITSLRSYKCTDPVDRIFALYSMTSNIQPLACLPTTYRGVTGIKPNELHLYDESRTVYMDIDYSLDVQQVYQKFAAACIVSDRGASVFEALIQTQWPPYPEDWPSWVPDWRKEPLIKATNNCRFRAQFTQICPHIVALAYTPTKISCSGLVVTKILQTPDTDDSFSFATSLRKNLSTLSRSAITAMTRTLVLEQQSKSDLIAYLSGDDIPLDELRLEIRTLHRAMENQHFFIATVPSVTEPVLGFGSAALATGDEMMLIFHENMIDQSTVDGHYTERCVLVRKKGTVREDNGRSATTHRLIGLGCIFLCPDTWLSRDLEHPQDVMWYIE
jgi:hypothetical protein